MLTYFIISSRLFQKAPPPACVLGAPPDDWGTVGDNLEIQKVGNNTKQVATSQQQQKQPVTSQRTNVFLQRITSNTSLTDLITPKLDANT